MPPNTALLIAESTLAAPVTVESALFFDAAPIPPDAASYAAEVSDTCVDGGDIALHADQGTGKIVGFVARYRANGLVGRGYLDPIPPDEWQGRWWTGIAATDPTPTQPLTWRGVRSTPAITPPPITAPPVLRIPWFGVKPR